MRTPEVNEIKSISFIGDCRSMSLSKLNRYTHECTKANGAKIRRILKRFFPSMDNELTYDFYNPYEARCIKKEGVLIYVHSCIEYIFVYN